MSTITPDLSGIVNGSTAQDTAWTVPINTITNAINGGLDNTNIAANAGITIDKLASGAWSTYTPVMTATGTAFGIGNGSANGKYIQIGKIVHFRVSITFGSTTTFGSGTYQVTLPVTGASTGLIGTWNLKHNTGVQLYAGSVQQDAPTTVQFWPAGGGAVITSTTPTTWMNGDDFGICGTYEAA